MSTIRDEFQRNLQSFNDFEDVYRQYADDSSFRSILIEIFCQILLNSHEISTKIFELIFNYFDINQEYLTENEFKQFLIPSIKHILTTLNDQHEGLIITLKFLCKLIEFKQLAFLSSTISEWLSIVLHFVVTRLTTISYPIYGDLVIDLLTKIVQHFTPLPKEIVDILGRSPSSIISTNFLSQLKTWVKHVDDTKLALFAIHLWQPLAALLSRLLTRGHTKGNEMLAVIQDAFIVANYSIRGAAFSAWASFMSHIYRSDLNLNRDTAHQQQQLYNRLLKLFLTPFLPDYTTKSKSASIAKCRAWTVLVSAYPTHIDDVILPFLSFAFGNRFQTKTWWIECRKLGYQCLNELLIDQINGELLIKHSGEQILNYLFDSVVDENLESSTNDETSICLANWNAYLTHLIRLFTSKDSITDQQRLAINTCLLTRMEQLWIDARIDTNVLLKLFLCFEQTTFPLAIETVLSDSSVRTKTLSATQNSNSQDKEKSSSSSSRTTLSDQYLHMFIEHSVRFTDSSSEQTYLHILSYLIETLSKTSDDNFCHQTNSLLLKCSYELTLQPIVISSLFWHIWLRCSTYLINILNRTRSLEIHQQRESLTIDLLLRPFQFHDSQRLDHSYTTIWIQLFKALNRLIILDDKHAIHLFNELFRNQLIFEQTIFEQQNQRLFGFLLVITKNLLKMFLDVDLSTVPKRSTSAIVFCLTEFSNIINHSLQRILQNDEQTNQWLSICLCLVKSNQKISSDEQAKANVFTFLRDLIIDLLNLCKTSSTFEIILQNLTELIPFLNTTEQQTDNLILNKFISTIQLVFDSTNVSSLLPLISPYLILAFQHSKTIIRNKMKKCWNETFGRVSFIVYPIDLRTCFCELKEKEHLILPNFLVDHEQFQPLYDGSSIPNSAEESQLSQQIEIATPLIMPARSSPARYSSPRLRSDKSDSIFVPITNNINYENSSDSPVIISKRMSSTSSCLTEKQKEKLRARHAIPILCDDSNNTQSLSFTPDTPTMENMLATYHLRSSSTGNKQSSNESQLSLISDSTCVVPSSSQGENNSIRESSSSSSPSTPPSIASTSSAAAAKDEDTPTEQIVSSQSTNEDEVPEESSIAKKLRRSRRPSTSARKSLTNNARKKRTIPAVSTTEEITTTVVPSESFEQVSSSSTNIEHIKARPLKSILKRLSPTKPRQDHNRHVAFHDQVKVLLFASPLRRDPNAQLQKKKSPIREETKSTITTRRSSGLHYTNPILISTAETKSNNLVEVIFNCLLIYSLNLLNSLFSIIKQINR